MCTKLKAGGIRHKGNRRYSPVLGEFISHEKGLGKLRKQFANGHINIMQTEYYIKVVRIQSQGRIIKIITRIIL